MMKTKKISPLDEKYFALFPPDPDFSVEHNQRVIEETIAKNDRIVRAKERLADEGARERSDATAHYLNSLKQGRANSVEGYFGKRHLAYLRGEQIVEQLKKLKQTN